VAGVVLVVMQFEGLEVWSHASGTARGAAGKGAEGGANCGSPSNSFWEEVGPLPLPILS